MFPRLSLVFAFVSIAGAQTTTPTAIDPASWMDLLWNLPVIRYLIPLPVPQPEWVSLPVPQPPPCSVSPLTEIADVEAQTFEDRVGSDEGVVDRAGLTPPTSRALEHFESVVVRVGGRIVVTSAYRPAPYQEHLQNVWDKWMVELRNNQDPNCAQLKAEVQDEFAKHQLLETQRPVPYSDHTRGIGFDADVTLPRSARLNRRRVSLDRLARLSGVSRPAVRRDPVHFRLRSL